MVDVDWQKLGWTKRAWTKPGIIVGIAAIIVTVILSMPIMGEEPDQEKIYKEIEVMLNEKVTIDIQKITKVLNNKVMQEPLRSQDLINNDIIYCWTDEFNTKCDELEELRPDISYSDYAFIFLFPGQTIIAENEKIQIKDCVIEMISIEPMTVIELENEWNDRQWCMHQSGYYLTDQYIPRGKSGINVNSLSMRYVDSSNSMLGLVTAYNFEKQIRDHMDKSEYDKFNVILLDNSNCVSAAVSKVNGSLTTFMDKGIWQLYQTATGQVLIERFNSTDPIRGTNCPNPQYIMDNAESIHITVPNSNVDNPSKLDGEYAVFEMNPLPENKFSAQKNAKIFHNWKLLVSKN